MSIVTLALVVLIVFAVGLVAIGAVNLYATDPRSRAVQVVLAGAVVLVIAVVYEAVGGGVGRRPLLVCPDRPAASRPEESRSSLMDDRPRYMISVAAELVGMHPQTLRIYESKGLVTPKRTAGNTRLYSDLDLERLRLIQQLTTELGLNLAGVEHVIRLEEQIRRMQRHMDRLEREMRDQIAQVRRQYAAELVPYEATRGDLIPRTWTSRG